MKYAVTQNGVRTQGDVHVEFDVVFCGHFCDMVQNLNSAFCPSKFLGIGIDHRGRRPHWGCGIQLIGPENHVDGLCDTLLSQPGNGFLKTTLTYKAPWADHIRPNFNVHK
jgi:hypothetical protein